MAFGSFDNQITRRGYVTKQMDQIWSERSTVQSWFDVEAAWRESRAPSGWSRPEPVPRSPARPKPPTPCR